MLTIRKSIEPEFADGEFIRKLLELDAEAYPQRYCGTFASVYGRFEKNRDMYLLLYDGAEIKGYAAFFPITDDLKRLIEDTDEVYDDDIAPSQIAPYTQGAGHTVFVISVVVAAELRGGCAAKLLMGGFEEFIRQKNIDGYKIDRIYGAAINEKGKGIMRKSGFSAVKTLADGCVLMAR